MAVTRDKSDAAAAITAGRTGLGIEFGSTRIKACLIGPDHEPIATGSSGWENQLVDGLWTYSLDAVWAGLQECYADLVADAERRHGVRPTTLGALGISAMMHGYLAFDADDELLVPFRTWRNTNTGAAAARLTQEFGFNIPLRWSVAHLYQALLDDEPHAREIAHLTTLAGYVHWRLTGRRVLGVGDASGMFPIDPRTNSYDRVMLQRFVELVAERAPGLKVAELFPDVLVAGGDAGELTAEGAALLDPSGSLRPGLPLCPPEGDAGTGMVATNAVAPRTGNVSAGTSIFAMVVLERPLSTIHPELDVVTTPVGDPVAMVHCNNGASELDAWASVFAEFAAALGHRVDRDEVFAAMVGAALDGDDDAGGLLAYNYLSGEPITEMPEGRPLFVRPPDASLTLANFSRAQLYGVFATLALGMRAFTAEDVGLDAMFAHGGLFRTKGVAQRLLAAVIDAPVAVGRSAGEGGAWGMAVLARYRAALFEQDLATYLREQVFASAQFEVVDPDPAEVAAFAAHLQRYAAALPVERAATQFVRDRHGG